MVKPKDFRPQLLAMARYFAKQEAIAQIRARGEKVSHYAAKDTMVPSTSVAMRSRIDTLIAAN
jgi:hypothetical protein